ncbi:MAG: preprotein translocase subunit YajC [Streptosporangiaceae bacterium]
MHYLAAAKSGGGNYTFLIVIVALFGLLYFVMIRPQRAKQRKVQEMQGQVQPGQRVRTTAGMYATVIESDDQDVLLEVAPGVQIRFLRRAVLDVLPDDDGMAGTDAGDATFHEQDLPEDVSSEATTDGPVITEHPNGTEHQNGSGPASTADHTAQDERTAE